MPALGLSNVRAERVMVPRWERGSESVEIVAPSRRKLAALALGGSVPTPPKGLEAEVIEVASLGALEAMDKAKVTGKIVFFSAKMERARDGSGYSGAARIRVFGPSRAAKLGAVGVVIRSAGTDNNRLPHTGVLVYDPAAPKVPAAALSAPDAELLARLLAAGKPVRLRMALNSKNLPDAASANVVGDVPGATAPDEVVLLGAHLDSWDVGMGAQDDAAGCAVVLEAARQIALLPNSNSKNSNSKRPRRTVRVVLFNNEENGGAGSAAYAKEHAAELSRHVAAIEADLGAGRVFAVRYLGGESGRPAFEALAGLLAPLGVEVRPEPAHGGADLGPLRAAGVPVIDLFQDLTTYFDIHHTENDTLDKIRKDDLDQVAAAFATAAFALADGEGDLGRVPEDKRVERR
jgi:carboxypeptidase Q